MDGPERLRILRASERFLEPGSHCQEVALSLHGSSLVHQRGTSDFHRHRHPHLAHAHGVEPAVTAAAEGGHHAGFWRWYFVSHFTKTRQLIDTNTLSVIATSSARLYELSIMVRGSDMTSEYSNLALHKPITTTNQERNKRIRSSLVFHRSQRLHHLRLSPTPPPTHFPHLLLLLPPTTPPLIARLKGTVKHNLPNRLPQTLNPRPRHLLQRLLLRRSGRLLRQYRESPHE